jgi:PAS domain S-box-containing protein
VFDLRSFSLDDMFRCSAELRAIGDTARDADDAAKRTVSFLFEQLQMPETEARQCALVRLFLTQPLSSLSVEDRAEVIRAIGEDASPSTVCLSLRATRGVRPEWNEPASSLRHRLIPLASPSAIAGMPMVSGLVSQLGVPTALLSSTPPPPDEHISLFNVFHVENARGSPVVPDQSEFVEPQGIRSVLGVGGLLPPSQVFVVILFSTVVIPKWTAELFRTLAPSIGFALLTPGHDARSAEICRHASERIVRHHEEVALSRLRELRETAEALASSLAERNRFMALVENSLDFIGIASPDQRVMYLNPAGRRMVGLSPTFDVTKTQIGDYYASDERARMEDVFARSTVPEGRWVGDTMLRNWQTQAGIPVSDHQFTIRDPDTGRVLGVGTVIRDISEKRHADEERERLLAAAQAARAEAQTASRAKDDFLASLGHELRNPLAPIVTAVELMKLRGARSREQEVIERQATHLARLVGDLLDVARIARGKISIQKKPVEIAAVVGRAVEATSPTFERRKQRLSVNVPPEGLLVNADLDRLSQVVSNLLDNASKYSRPGTDVSISAERAGKKLRLRVRDQGIGIPPDMLDTIFESFVQHGQEQAGSAPGLGLGLSIVRSLVQLHGGTVSARSEGPGKGSEFVVELPLATAAAVPSVTTSEAKPDVPLPHESKKRILLVEDNHDAASVLADALSELGHTVLVATDSRSALDVAHDFRPDVALLDIGLPVLDGYELGRRLRRLPEMPEGLRLVALTGYGQEGDQQRSLEAGFAAHLVKPVALEALMAAVR